MTHLPQTIGAEQNLRKAHEMMREHGIRHLPVQQAGKLVGILSDRDLKLAQSFGGMESLTCEEVMTPEPYCVELNAPLDLIVSTMSERKLGCTIVKDDQGAVAGIFTDTDALRIFCEVLRLHYADKLAVQQGSPKAA